MFVFPSRTDTFGIVMIEAMASGLPVAAYPVPGPIDVVGPGAGVLDEDLRAACLKALTLSREQAREHSMRFTWKESARQFLENIEASRSDLKLKVAPSPEDRQGRPGGRDRMTRQAMRIQPGARTSSKEKQGKPRNSKEISLDFLGFLWPNRAFSMSYGESK